MSAITDIGEEWEALICGIPNIDDDKRREFREAFIRERNIAHRMRVEAGESEESLSSVKRHPTPYLPQESEKLLTFDTHVTFSPGLDWYWDEHYTPPLQIPGATTLMGPLANDE
jgi:hypothetical protein